MNPATKRMLADRYPKMLIFANAAHKRGLDASPSFKKVVQFYRTQILTQELARSIKEQSEKIPQPDIDKYYKDNAGEFQQASLQRLYVPKQKQVEAAGDKPESKSADQQKADEEALKKEADALHTRAAAGEDFDKLQKEAYEAAGLKGTPPQTNIGQLTRDELPVTHRSVMDLKAGEVSQVITEPNGYYIYKVVSKDEKPLNAVQAEIKTKLAQQKFQDEMQRIESSAKTELNEAYFGAPPAAPGMPGTMPGAGAAPRQMPAEPQSAPSGASPTTPPAPPTQTTNPETENPKK
jgi:parvulin-like peptidyl-prolyl isomerase